MVVRDGIQIWIDWMGVQRNSWWSDVLRRVAMVIAGTGEIVMGALPAQPTGSATDMNGLILEFIIPYMAYFLGTVIRRYGIPGDNSPLRCLLLLAIPLNLTIVTPILLASSSIIHLGFGYSYLVIIGIIVEQGMVVHEVATRRIHQAINGVPSEVVS